MKQAIILLCLALVGCVTEAEHIHPTTLPNGKPGYVVVCNSPSLRDQALKLHLAAEHKVRLLGHGTSNGVDVERFAPGFRQVILARHMFTAARMEEHNPNLVGGDINGGAQDLPQLFLRPTRRLYRTSAKDIYICSASTPPGGGVHGMCGYYAAKAVIDDLHSG